MTIFSTENQNPGTNRRTSPSWKNKKPPSKSSSSSGLITMSNKSFHFVLGKGERIRKQNKKNRTSSTLTMESGTLRERHTVVG